jgi:hypothetical protein
MSINRRAAAEPTAASAPDFSIPDFYVDPLEILYRRSRVLAWRVTRSQLNFIDAVDMAYDAAQWAGLIETYGDDLVQGVLATAFMGIDGGKA